MWKSETKYSYNIEGFRDKKISKDGTTRFIYDGMNISSEIMPDGTVYNYYRANELIGYTNSKNEKVYYNQNSHGDITSVYDIFGKEIKEYSYNAFGKEQIIKTNFDGANPFLYMWKSETTKVHNPFRYAGEYFDEETGFVYLRNRYYNPNIGRFTQEDPIRDGLNWYAYCENNPIAFVDPWGLYNLEKGENSKVYAIIESGDTLSNIAKSEVNDGNAYTKMNYSGDPNKIQIGQRIDITGIYNRNYPNPFSKEINSQYSAIKFKNTTLKNTVPVDTPIIDFSVELGTGVYVQAEVFGASVEIGGKRYYDMSKLFIAPTDNMQFSAMLKITDYVQAGGSITGTINAKTGEHLKNSGFAGIKIGNQALGFESSNNKEDFILNLFNIGFYLGVGGEVGVSVNISELLRSKKK